MSSARVPLASTEGFEEGGRRGKQVEVPDTPWPLANLAFYKFSFVCLFVFPSGFIESEFLISKLFYDD